MRAFLLVFTFVFIGIVFNLVFVPNLLMGEDMFPPNFSWMFTKEPVLVILAIVSITAVVFMAFSLRFSFGPTEEFEEWKNSELATGSMHILTTVSAMTILLSMNGFFLGYSWFWFVGVAVLASLVIGTILRIDPARWRQQSAWETFPVPPGFGDRIPPPGGYYDCRNGVIRSGTGRVIEGIRKKDSF